MSKLVDNYLINMTKPIGSGQYGNVYLAKNKKDLDLYAVKVIKKRRFHENPRLELYTKNEIETMTLINSDHVLGFYEVLKSKNNTYFIYEYCNGGDLETYLKKKEFLKEDEAIKILIDLLEAFKEMNKNNIIHRDIKPSNILIHNGKIKLGDFGFCKKLKSSKTLTKTMLGSPLYMAPEILKGHEYGLTSDIWSLGVLIYELLY